MYTLKYILNQRPHIPLPDELPDSAHPQLYASSLTGQGLSLDVSFVRTLEEQGTVYGKELEAFKKAVKGKDKGKVREGVVDRRSHGPMNALLMGINTRVFLPKPRPTKHPQQALAALEKMEAAVALYRKTARIDTPDGGIG